MAGQCTSSTPLQFPYSAAGVAHFGNLSSKAIYGPGFADLDFPVFKNVKLEGSARVSSLFLCSSV